jgi:hypothetical protein
MPLVALLWLTLLSGLTLAAPDSPRGGASALAQRAEGRGTSAERRLSARVAAHVARAPEETIRLAAGVTRGAVGRSTGPTASGGAPPSALLAPAWARAPAPTRRSVQGQGVGSHVVAARGRLLPYFPTAPPRLG